MKKNFLICFFTIFTFVFTKQQEITSINYSYIVDNYEKTKNYNISFTKLKNKLIKKYDSKLEDKLSEKETTTSFKKEKEILTEEIAEDIEIAIQLIGRNKNYNTILNKESIVYKKKKRKDISNEILKFLNYTYNKEIKFSNFKKIDTLSGC